jgi:hypothetical protein
MSILTIGQRLLWNSKKGRTIEGGEVVTLHKVYQDDACIKLRDDTKVSEHDNFKTFAPLSELKPTIKEDQTVIWTNTVGAKLKAKVLSICDSDATACIHIDAPDVAAAVSLWVPMIEVELDADAKVIEASNEELLAQVEHLNRTISQLTMEMAKQREESVNRIKKLSDVLRYIKPYVGSGLSYEIEEALS